jgi:DNA repair protein RAD57
MTDLLHVLPDFPTKSFTHLIPSLEKHLVTTSDLLTLGALEVAKKAQLPLLDVRRLANHVIASLHAELGLNKSGSATTQSDVRTAETEGKVSLSHSRKILTEPWVYISTLDPTLDATLGGGIPPGYLTEIVGERY